MNNPSIRKNFIYSSFYQILILITPFITAPYISRVLGVDGVGIYSYTYSIMTYFSMFAGLGVLSYGNREIAQHRDNKEECSKLFYEMELLIIINTCITIVVWGIFVVLYVEYRMYLFILTIHLIGVMFDISWFFGGLEKYAYIVRKNIVCKLLSILLLFLLIKDSNDLWLYILIISGFTALGNISMWTCLPRFLTKVDFKNLAVKRHFKSMIVYFIPTIATSVYTVLDKTLIGAITKDNFENGYYEQATKIINMAKAITFTSLNSVMAPRISYLFANNKMNEIHSKIEKTLNYILLIGIASTFGIIGISKGFIPWFFGNGYDSVIYLLRLFSPIIIIIGISNCVGSLYYTPVGLRVQSTKYIIIGSCVNLVLNLCFIPYWGSFGAVVASLIAESIIAILYVHFSNGFVTLHMIVTLSWKRIIAACVMLVIILLIGIRKESTISLTVIQIGVGSISYFLILLLLKDNFLYKMLLEIHQKMIKKRKR